VWGIVAILIGLALLMYWAYRGVTLLLLAPAMSILVVALTGGLPLMGSYTQVFMVKMGEFVALFFPLFLLGAVFGKLMDDSGCAGVIARTIIGRLGSERAILAVVICCAILTYGGVSLFVVAFAIFPVAAALFRDGDIPKRLIPASLALGAFTFTMSALPGSPAIQNAIPMPFFGTTAFAAPGIGIIASLFMFAFGIVWLNRQAQIAKGAGEGYGDHDDAVAASTLEAREGAIREGCDIKELEQGARPDKAGPSFALAIAPVVIVVAVNFAFVQLVVPRMNTAFLAQPLFGETTVEAVRGVWAIIVALVAAIAFILAANWSRIESVKSSLDHGANASVIPIANTASLVGFGAVIAFLPAFHAISDALLALGEDNPLVSLAIAVNILTAITGSASGGMSIALESLAPTYVALAASHGIPLEAMRRITSMASGTLDSLPHNGAVITILAIAKLSHGAAFRDIFVVAIVGPLLALVGVLILVSFVGSF